MLQSGVMQYCRMFIQRNNIIVWHSVEPLPDSFWTKAIDIQPLANADDIAQQLPVQRERVAYIGYAQQRAQALGFSAENINPKPVLDYLHAYTPAHNLFYKSGKNEGNPTPV